MSGPYWRSPAPRAAAVLAAASAAALAGCSSAGTGAAQDTGAVGQASMASAGTAADTLFTAAQLRGALLTKVDGAGPAGPTETGAYGLLPEVRTSRDSLRGVVVKPAKCAQAGVTGFDSAVLASAPASVVTFRVGRDGVSEVLVAADDATAARALAAHLPGGCAHYRATVDGKTFRYAVREAALHGIGEQARALNVKAAGYAQVDVWSVVYRGHGFLGALTIVGPDATEASAKVLAKDAYARAAESLH